MYFNRQGKPISPETWRELITEEEYCLIAYDAVGKRHVVETRWTGYDENGSTQPLFIYETTVMRGRDELMERMSHSTLEEARSYHKRCKCHWRKKLGEVHVVKRKKTKWKKRNEAKLKKMQTKVSA